MPSFVQSYPDLCLAPGIGILLSPVPVVDIGGIRSLLNDPPRITLAPLSHSVFSER